MLEPELGNIRVEARSQSAKRELLEVSSYVRPGRDALEGFVLAWKVKEEGDV